MNFDEAFDRLIGHEAGFSIDPADPGNWTGGVRDVGELKGTNFGIAANTYPDIDIEGLTLEEAKAIYYRDWWLKLGADKLDEAIVFQLWDFAVNSGMGNAKRVLQRAVGVAEDGRIGPVTLQKIASMSKYEVLFKFTAAKIRFYTSLSTWPRFGKGWMNRTAGQLDYCAADTALIP